MAKYLLNKYRFQKITTLVLILVLSSCSSYSPKINKALTLAGENADEIKKTITHYKKLHNKEKLKAAYFLIENMPGKGTYINNLKDKQGQAVEFNIADFEDEAGEKKWLDSVTKEKGPLREHEEFQSDLQYIKASFLINNIDRAFEARQNSPYAVKISDSDFYEYLLPYRTSTEKLEFWRDQVLDHLTATQKDSIYSFTSVLAATNYLDKIYRKRFSFGERRYFKQKKVRSYSELIKDKAGKCNDMCNLMVSALRAVGIPSGFDRMDIKRASNDVGHEWCFIIDVKNGRKYPFDALSDNGPGLFHMLYKNAPNVSRRQFALLPENSIQNNESIIYPLLLHDNSLNVTSEYYETADVIIPLQKKYKDPVYLSVWSRGRWNPIGFSINGEESSVHFKDISKENLYCLTSYRYFALEEIQKPFIVDKFGEVCYINSGSEKAKQNFEINKIENKEIKKAKTNTKVLEFESRKEICRKVANEKVNQQDEWKTLCDQKLKAGDVYLLINEEEKINKVFILKNDGSLDWY